MQIERAPQQVTKPPDGPPSVPARRSPSPTRWLIARDVANGRLEPLCVHAGGARVLPVFSFEEEAEMFVLLGGYDGYGWRTRESSAGELVSVLCGPCVDVEGVALDPLPEIVEDGTIDLIEVERRRFVRRLLAREGEQTASS